jgi:hypothetical protein
MNEIYRRHLLFSHQIKVQDHIAGQIGLLMPDN